MKKLVLGPGPGFQDRKRQDLEKGIETIGIDIIPEFEPDFCMDIEQNKILSVVGQGEFDEVEAHHIFEHIQSNKDFKRIMWEIFEALKPGGYIDICVPYWKDDSAVECFEHIRFFNENSFMNFYDNRYGKEMGLPMFEKIVNEVRQHGNGSKEVHVCMRKV